jgi:hypothetical protein
MCRERYLKVMDGAMRKEVLRSLDLVEEGQLEPSTHILHRIYPR